MVSQIGGYLSGVPIERIVVFWRSVLGPLFWETTASVGFKVESFGFGVTRLRILDLGSKVQGFRSFAGLA